MPAKGHAFVSTKENVRCQLTAMLSVIASTFKIAETGFYIELRFGYFEALIYFTLNILKAYFSRIF